MTEVGERIPTGAKWLGFSGLIPFIGCALAVSLAPEPYKSFSLSLLLGYGAVILSFLGGVHWGLAIAPGSAQTDLTKQLALSVIPSLIAWVALFLQERLALIVLALSIALVLIVDRMSVREGRAPAWFMALRRYLSIGAIASLLLAAFI